jgi:hypothetical protein
MLWCIDLLTVTGVEEERGASMFQYSKTSLSLRPSFFYVVTQLILMTTYPQPTYIALTTRKNEGLGYIGAEA